jgi:hypothetical protein
VSKALDHFIDLALQGKRRGCSTYERGSRVLARAVVQYIPGMDGLARDGLREFINLTSNSPGTARDQLYGDAGDES